MKKIVKNQKVEFLYMGIVLLGVVSLGFFTQSCYKKDDVLSSSLELAMLSIENDAKLESKKIQEISISDVNIKFFSEIKRNKDKPLLKSTTSNVQIDESPIIKQVIADYPFQEGETLSNDETIILKSYFKCAKNKDIDKVLLTQYYLDKIDKLDVDEWTKYRCNACLSLIRDALMVSTRDKTAAPRLKSPYEYTIGDYVSIFEDCLHRCIDAKLSAIFNGNWFDKVWFISHCPADMLVYTTSCTISCL